ncbi:MAG: molybdopterin-binding protein [Armatimonadota bacterium]|nr:hypothetical protein [bacterium]
MVRTDSETASGVTLDLPRARECAIESVSLIGSEQAGIINTFGKTLAESIDGEEIISKGTVIGPSEMSMLARMGKPGIAVRRKPKVAVITTGADVVEIVEDIRPGQVRNVARYEIVGMVLESGCEVGRLIHVRDEASGLEKAISESLGSDAIIIALGSKDSHEIAVTALKNLGDIRFAQVRLAPGFATAFAMVEGRPAFIVPEAAALESFEALIRPALLTMLGRTAVDRKKVTATISAAVKLDSKLTHYIRALTVFEDGRYVVKPFDSHRHECLNSLIVVGANVESVRRGDEVEVMMLA